MSQQLPFAFFAHVLLNSFWCKSYALHPSRSDRKHISPSVVCLWSYICDISNKGELRTINHRYNTSWKLQLISGFCQEFDAPFLRKNSTESVRKNVFNHELGIARNSKPTLKTPLGVVRNRSYQFLANENQGEMHERE